MKFKGRVFRELAPLFLMGISGCSHLRPTVESFPYWISLGPDSHRILRAVIPLGESCPSVTADGKVISLAPRTRQSADFPIQVCEKEFDSSFSPKTWTLTGKDLPVINPHPKRVLIIGDTGCRIKMIQGSTHVQACNDPNAWPFAQVALAASAWRPDLVVHVGDYHYREAPCPVGDARCRGSVPGDQWESWKQDFFSPAEPLLRSSPWIFVRGNHELCSRGGRGWFNLLDPRKFSEKCAEQTASYAVKFGNLSLIILDSADDKNISPSLSNAETFASGQDWILSHRPFLSAGGDDESTAQYKLPPQMRSAGRVGLVLSGHHHVMSLDEFPEDRPPEIVSGNGGSELDVFKKNGAATSVFQDFGFMTFEELNQNQWSLAVHDRTGAVRKTCKVVFSHERQTKITCQ